MCFELIVFCFAVIELLLGFETLIAFFVVVVGYKPGTPIPLLRYAPAQTSVIHQHSRAKNQLSSVFIELFLILGTHKKRGDGE